MIKKIYAPILISLLFAGCGGGGSTSTPLGEKESSSIEQTLNSNTTTNITTTTSFSPSDINLTKDIQEGKISHYDPDDPIEDQYLSVINYFRSLPVKCDDPAGLEGPAGSDLEWNDLLEEAAKEHSEDMRLAEHYAHAGSGTASDKTAVAHNLSEGSTPFERMEYNGYDFSTASENIAKVARYPELQENEWIGIMEAWMTSKTGHCSNIMNPNFTDFGMYESSGTGDTTFSDGVTRTTPVLYWTQNFGRPQ